MKVVIEVWCNNSAFYDDAEGSPAHGPEFARILRNLADECETDSDGSETWDGMRLTDSNGNRVGAVEVEL